MKSSHTHQLRIFLAGLLVLGVVLLLAVTVKTNNPEHPWQLTNTSGVGGPFESSNTAARYALVQAIVENNSFALTAEQARLAVPDMVEKDGRFLISFTPGISMVAALFYRIGRLGDMAALATTAFSISWAFINGVLLYVLAKKIGAATLPAAISAGIFLFATNALVYAPTLTQHHASTMILLLALLNALEKRTWWRNALFGLYSGLGILFDIPNAFLLFPIGLYIVSQHISATRRSEKLSVSLRTSFVWIVIGMLPLALIFMRYNQLTMGSVSTLAQFSPRSNYFDTAEKKQADAMRSAKHDAYQSTLPFNTRQQLEGAYILLLSDERGWLWYSPVLILGMVGLWWLYKKNPTACVLIVSVISVNLVIYSMFGDPWGGWSFGPRYLIPAAALLSAASSLTLTKYGKSYLWSLVFFVLIGYSVAISSAGALTSALIPPKQESQALVAYIPWTYKYNFLLLQGNKSQSLVYQLGMKKYLTASQFYLLYVSLILGSFLVMMLCMSYTLRKKTHVR